MLVACVLLFAFSAVGLLALAVQLWCVRAHSQQPIPVPRSCVGISILKPLCGVDDALASNLACFARLDYPAYEVLLGVRDTSDAAYPVAMQAAKEWPNVFRVVLQRSSPGFNPKVNQLITLERLARHDLLLVSDSNVRVPSGYLQEVAARFEDPEVACVTHPVVGHGEQTLGSWLDNLHLCSAIGAGMISARRVAERDLVVGKSMALRRKELERLGGFAALKDYLAEDYVVGKAVTEVLGRQVALARLAVENISEQHTVKRFFARYCRWSVIHRTAVAPTTYLSQGLLNPLPLALIGWMAWPTSHTAAALWGVLVLKTALDLLTVRAMRGYIGSGWAVPLVAVKDLLLFAAWVQGAVRSTVVWRGHRLRVAPGSRLVDDAAPHRARV